MINQDILDLLDETHPKYEITYLGSSIGLDVFKIYLKGKKKELGQLRIYNSDKRGYESHFVRFDVEMDSPNPLMVEDDEDGNSWTAPGWETLKDFEKSFELKHFTDSIELEVEF